MPDLFEDDSIRERDRRMLSSSEEPVTKNPLPDLPKTTEESLIKDSSTELPKTAEVIHFPAPEPRPRHMIGDNRMHIFSAFCEIPAGVTFETQEEGEKILLLIRKSFITNIPWVVTAIVLAIIPPVIMQFFHPEKTPLVFLSPSYLFVLISLYYLFIAAYVFISFISWYFNTALITSERIVDIDFQDLVYKNIAETKMDLIQDVSYTQTGVLRTLFGFGDVLVQTAGAVDNFDLLAIPHPDRTVEIIENLIGKDREAGV